MICDNRPVPLTERVAQVGVSEVLDMLAALGRAGIDTERVAREAGIDTDGLECARAVPGPAVVRMFAAAQACSGDPLIGLHCAELAEPRGPVAHLLMCCSSLEEALARCCRFGPVLITTARLGLEQRDNHLVIVYDIGDDDLDASIHLVHYALMASARAAERAFGRDAGISTVHFKHAERGTRGEVERAFGCPARFSESANRMFIPRGLGTRRPHMSNPLIADQIEKFAAALLPTLTEPERFTDRVAMVTRSLLNSGTRAERRQVGKRLGVSERSLHRHLAEEGSSFRAVREDVLWEVATALMSERNVKLEAIALSVGFGDAAAFSKAFKRRTGKSPNDYRRGVLASAC